MVSRAFGAGLALMLMVLALFALARFLGGKNPGELTRRQRRRMQRPTQSASPPRPTDRPAKQVQTQLSEA